MRKAVDETQYPNGVFEFLVPSMNTSENLSSVEFAIVRKGGTEGKASVTFKAIDVTAKYGDDYTISVQKGLFPITLPNNPDSKPLIESFEDIENASVTTGSSIINERSQPTTGSGIQYEELPTPQLKVGGSGLRAARDTFTGTVSERATWREADQDTINKALIAQNEMYDEMPGITYTFNFEDGEYIKKIRFNTIDDTISEDDEQVLFVLLNPVGASLGETINAYMNIEDNEEKEKVVFEMAEEQIIVDRLNGYVEVKVRRTAGLHRYGFIQLGTAALTAKPNIDYEPLSTQLNFVPGQETQTVRIPLLEGISNEEIQFIVKLDPESPNIFEGGKTKTLITIKAKPAYLMQTVNTQPESLNHLKSHRSINIYLKSLESDEDACIKPRIWKSAEIYEEGPAQYVGTLEFSYGPDSTLGEFAEWDYARFRPKISDKFAESYDYGLVYLWGYKIERKGGLSGDRYYSVASEYLEVGELLNNQLKDYNGRTIPLSEVLMEGNSIAVLPVYKQRTSFVQINFDPSKGGMDNNSFSNGQIIKVGMMDTIEFRAFANGGNTVSGYEQVHSYMYYDYISRAPDNYMERDYNKQKTEDVEILFGDSYKGRFYRADMFWNYEEMTTNPVLPGEMNYKPVATFSKVSVRYGTSSLTVKADPTYGDRDKGSVAYFPDEGIAQAGNSENPMVISPVERNKLYIISGVPDKGYRMIWKDWTGDINGDGYLDKEEVDRFGKYEGMFDRKTVAGNFFTYVPAYDHPLIYYGFEPIGSGGAEGKVSGRILLKGKSILNDKEEDKPLAGVSLNINGHSISTDENGEFEIIHSDFKSNQYQNIIITYKEIKYMGHINVNAFSNIVIDEYDTFVPYNFEAYNFSNGNKIDFRTIDNRDEEYSFVFNVKSRKQGISAAKALIRFYSKEGIERLDSSIEVEPKSGIFAFKFNPSSLDIVPGDTMTVQLIDQNGLEYMEHNAGFFFKKNLNTFSLLSSFESPAKDAVDLIGQLDASFDLGLAGKIDDYMDKTGKDGTEWTITFGFSKDWEKSLSDGSKVDKKEDGSGSDNAAAEELKEAAKSKDTGKISDKVEKSVDKNNDKKKTSSITSDIKFGISTSLFLRMTVNQDPASPRYGEAYFNEMIMSATFTGEYDKKVERMTPIGVTLFVGINFKGGVTGMIVIEKYDENFYFNEEGDIDFSKAGTSNLDRDFTIYGKLMVKPSITLYAGAKITGANVTLKGTAAFDLNFITTGSGSGKVRLSSELTLKILLFEYSWDIAGKEWDLFSYSKSGYLGMDDFIDASILYESAENYNIMPRDYLLNRRQWQNDNDLLMSAYGLETIAQNEYVLQTGIYPYPYTLLATIGEDSYLLIFLDDDISHNDRNKTQLYYSIYDGNSWSIPQKVDDDGTPDGLPWLYDIGDKVLVAWSSSVSEIKPDDTVMSVLNNRNIKSRFFYKEDKSFGDVQEVTQHTKDDTYADTEPYIAYWKDDSGKENLMITYKKSDYMATSGTGDDNAVVGDIINPYYFTSAYRFYDFDRKVWDDRAEGGEMPGMFYGQGFIDLSEYVYVD
ncbi:MAG: Calx-beta domain-containing protein, partial [Tissierellia bacterium]|nr:Calx-beta domain-containing protein [Tissierellia bacterium]